MFSSSGQQFNQFDASNMLGNMLANSMRVAGMENPTGSGDPFGGNIRQLLGAPKPQSPSMSKVDFLASMKPENRNIYSLLMQ